MISSKDFDCSGFNRSLEERGVAAKLNTIDTLIRVADEGDHWKGEFYKQALLRAKKTVLRRLMREGYREDGKHVQFLNIEEFDPETKEIKQGYKQLDFLTVDNFEWAIRAEDQRIGAAVSKRKWLMKVAVEKYGKEIQLRFSLEKALSN